MYRQEQSVAVDSGASDGCNLAGFGLRRFMQDAYQQHQYQPQYEHHAPHHNKQPPIHQGHHAQRAEQSRHRPNASGSYGRVYNSREHTQASDSQSFPALSPYHDDHHHTPYFIQERQAHYTASPQNLPADLPPTERVTLEHVTSGSRIADPTSVCRSDSLASSATASTANLAYARSISGDSPSSRNRHLVPASPLTSSRSIRAPTARAADRATVYEDDYEEPHHVRSIDSTHRPRSPASASLGDVLDDVSFSIVRATVFEPDLPKAKCADCGEKLDFEALASHSCQSSSSTKQPLLKIQLPASVAGGSTLSPSLTSPAVSTPRSPFFDRYDHLVGEAGPLSPALLQAPASAVQSQGQKKENDETPKAHAVRIVGPQAAMKMAHITSPTSPPASEWQPHRTCKLDEPPVLQRSASDTDADAAARRRVIEQQRAAKQKDFLTSHLPRAATTSSLEKAPSAMPTLRRANTSFVAEGQHTKTESSSSVSSASTNASEPLLRLAYKHSLREKNRSENCSTANITPSSSYEQFDDEAAARHTKQPVGKLGDKTSAPSRERSGVDLSSIEEMMKGLTASPEASPQAPIERDVGSKLTVDMLQPAAQRARSATDASKTERERALELEVERLRDKERARRLQAAQLLKEKKSRERADKRCCVCNCSLSSNGTRFVERDGKYLCARDWKELYLPKCRKCNVAVEKGAVKSSDGALRGVFHRSCFSCAACEAPFSDGSFYVFNNQPYCSRHYHRLNGSLCRECENGIEGDCRQTDTGDRFHPSCFHCQYSSQNGSCREPLADYYVVGGQRLCERHADKVGRQLAKAGQQQQLDLRSQKRMTMLRTLG